MSQGAPAGVLVVFAKAPRPGLVKTRMCPPLEPAEAAELYGCMLDDVLEASVAHAKALGLELVLAVHPEDAQPELADRTPPPFRVIAQHGEGLARRMDRAIRQACAAGHERVILRGSDNPGLGLDHLRATLDLLKRHDVVLTPDRDGGYGAIGLHAPHPGLFDHAMSTDRLLDETTRSARERGLAVALAPESFDLDTVDDLARLGERPGGPEAARESARTLAWADSHELGPTRRNPSG